MDTPGTDLPTQKSYGTPAKREQEYLTIRKEYTWNHTKLRRKEGKKEEPDQDWICPWGWGNGSRGQIPTMGQLFGTEEKHLGLYRVSQLICDSLN